MKKIVSFLLCLQFILIAPAVAQEQESEGDDFVKTTQNDILTVVGAGAAGAILGLSTLSFVDRPSQHLRNIYSGAAVGIIAGVIFVAYNSAQRGAEDLQSSQEFNTYERVAWHQEKAQNLTFDRVHFGTQFWHLSF